MNNLFFETSDFDTEAKKEMNNAMASINKIDSDIDKNFDKAEASTAKEDVSNTVGSMLPQGMGYDTSVLSKNGVISEEDEIDSDGKALLNVCDELVSDVKIESAIYNFIISESVEYDTYMEASVFSLIKEKLKKPDLNKLESLYIKSQVLLCKKQYMTSKFSDELNKKELRQLDRDCISAEKEFRKAMKKATVETKQEFEKSKKKLNKVIQAEFKIVKERLGKPVSKTVKFSGVDKLKNDKSVIKESCEMNFSESYDWKNEWEKESNEAKAYMESKLINKLFGEHTFADLKHFSNPDKIKAISILKKVYKLQNKTTKLDKDGKVITNERLAKKLDSKIKVDAIANKDSREQYKAVRFIDLKVFDFERLITETLKLTGQAKKIAQHSDITIKFNDRAVREYTDKDIREEYKKKTDMILKNKNHSMNLDDAAHYLSSDYDRYEKVLITEMKELIKLAKKVGFKTSQQAAFDDTMDLEKSTGKLFDNSLQKLISQTYTCVSTTLGHLRKLNNHIIDIALDIDKGTSTLESVEMDDSYFEAANVGEKMRPIIALLNTKGYRTKYSSPGYHKERRKEDVNKDGVYNGKLYTTGRIMFEEPYKFPPAPKYWKFRQVDGKDYLDVEEKWFNPKGEKNPDEAWTEWQEKYLASMMKWVKDLDYKTDADNGGNDKNDIDNDESINVRHHTNKDSRADIADDKKDDNKSKSESSKKEDDVKESVFDEIDSLMEDMFVENGLY